MAFTPPAETYPGKICAPTFGVGDTTLTFGGENVLPFHAFEGSVPNRPVIAYVIQDIPPVDWPETVQKVYSSVSQDPVAWVTPSGNAMQE